ncbi:fibronectin type III domain-containing protein [Spirilliplanes yamanashiensis]|uniref:Fibronectin type-III domain-containing protein n=1 Tax=Spirilliplanes yamanashiensis TaxID=42233 RepID=A0A8J3YA25_9ACTN|nr:fibronectin type III domain-containing protein [Spirilliplanes yamanashiensis]MDP9815731.1 hypothetical protein [Spirilliplanes yamanashiensis]GIJ03985.1 hypothetical protein Sya03_33370 [Spirilliplanes yamanashiensis]
MRRLLAAAATAVLSAALLAAPPAAAAPADPPNLVANGDFNPTLGLAETGWVCEEGTVPEQNLPGAEFVQVMPLKDPFVPATVVPRPAPPAPEPAEPEPGTAPVRALSVQSAPPAPVSALDKSPIIKDTRLAGRPTASTRAECAQVVPVRANSSYTLTAKVRGGWAFLGSDYGTAFTPPSVREVTLTHTFTTGPATDSVRIYVHGWYGEATYRARDVVLTGPPSDTRVPEPPRGFHVGKRTSGSAVVYWAPAPGATSYELWRDGEPVATTANFWAVVPGLTPGQRHVFTVRSRNDAGVSAPSADFVPALAPVDEEPPQAPRIGLAGAGSGGALLYLDGSPTATDGFLIYVDGVVVGWTYAMRVWVPMDAGTRTVEVVAYNAAGPSPVSARTVIVPAG